MVVIGGLFATACGKKRPLVSDDSGAASSKKAKASPAQPHPPMPHPTEVLRMDAAALHLAFPFTEALAFDTAQIWADKDHQTLSKPCDKAGKNVFGHSVIVGHNPKKGKPNFWVCGKKDGTIVPYNLKLKYVHPRRMA